MRKWLAGCLLLLWSPWLVAAETKPAPPRSAVLSRLEKVASAVKTLSGDFVQEKHLSVFREVMVSKGRFFFQKPDRLRWELLTPVKSGFVITGAKGKRWNELTGRSEAFSAEKDPVMKIVAEQLFAWAGANFALVEKQYRVTVLEEKPVSLRLEPASPEMANYLEYLKIDFSPDDRHVQRVEVHEKGGDFTRIQFAHSVVNGPLAADLF